MTATKRRLNLKTVRMRVSRLFATRLTKRQLRLLSRRITSLAKYIWSFLKRHRQLSEGILVGALAAILLVQLPWIGDLLAILCVSAGAFVGMIRELMGLLDESFNQPQV
jgi:uncharacterized membrane protein